VTYISQYASLFPVRKRRSEKERKDARHANTLSRALTECNEVLVKFMRGIGVKPALRVECVGIREEVRVAVHCPCAHANISLQAMEQVESE
jgi:hypothetical protein